MSTRALFRSLLVLIATGSLLAQAEEVSSRLIKVGVREMLAVDSKKMEKFIDTQMRKVQNEDDDDVFIDAAATVLAQYILVHPNLTERQAGISVLRGRLSDGLYPLVLESAAHKLLAIAKNSTIASDQASAFWALSNLVKEAKSLRAEEKDIIKPVLKEISDSSFELSSGAKKYSREALMPLVAPEKEAKAALQSL